MIQLTRRALTSPPGRKSPHPLCNPGTLRTGNTPGGSDGPRPPGGQTNHQSAGIQMLFSSKMHFYTMLKNISLMPRQLTFWREETSQGLKETYDHSQVADIAFPVQP